MTNIWGRLDEPEAAATSLRDPESIHEEQDGYDEQRQHAGDDQRAHPPVPIHHDRTSDHLRPDPGRAEAVLPALLGEQKCNRRSKAPPLKQHKQGEPAIWPRSICFSALTILAGIGTAAIGPPMRRRTVN